jgi:hypothetical protein
MGCDPVNAAMIRHWCEAMGYPLEWEGAASAPTAMLQCWLFPGPTRQRPPGSALADATSALELLCEGGYSAAVAVSTEIECARDLKAGDRLLYSSRVESISDEKRTGLGPGRFVGFRLTVRDSEGSIVGTIRFTHLAYRPRA